LPREVIITDSDIREAISSSINTLVDGVKEVLETTPPEVLADIMQKGIFLAGGGALISGLSDIIADYTKIPVHIAPDPLTAVCRGTGVILENIEMYKDILITNKDELPPKK
jgi:rod shape-determining protein MreB